MTWPCWPVVDAAAQERAGAVSLALGAGAEAGAVAPMASRRVVLASASLARSGPAAAAGGAAPVAVVPVAVVTPAAAPAAGATPVPVRAAPALGAAAPAG